MQLLTRKYCGLNCRLYAIVSPISMDNLLLLEVDPQRENDVEGSCIAITIRPLGTALTRKWVFNRRPNWRPLVVRTKKARNLKSGRTPQLEAQDRTVYGSNERGSNELWMAEETWNKKAQNQKAQNEKAQNQVMNTRGSGQEICVSGLNHWPERNCSTPSSGNSNGGDCLLRSEF